MEFSRKKNPWTWGASSEKPIVAEHFCIAITKLGFNSLFILGADIEMFCSILGSNAFLPTYATILSKTTWTFLFSHYSREKFISIDFRIILKLISMRKNGIFHNFTFLLESSLGRDFCACRETLTERPSMLAAKTSLNGSKGQDRWTSWRWNFKLNVPCTKLKTRSRLGKPVLEKLVSLRRSYHNKSLCGILSLWGGFEGYFCALVLLVWLET